MSKINTYLNSSKQTHIVTQNLDEVFSKTGNIYESIAIISKRSKQIAMELKNELYHKLEDMRTSHEEMEEIKESREQIELSKKYEKLAHPTIISTEEFLQDELEFRYREISSEKL
ncbi:MAG: DNA-directed RNA polymerase subunit omega [Chitinophagales bacterium]|jgi:DNA-directed RNA polymerase subunit K/omega|nr:DNA-directed RNA polymerase subunit omega [Chitinophagales bacterium]